MRLAYVKGQLMKSFERKSENCAMRT